MMRNTLSFGPLPMFSWPMCVFSCVKLRSTAYHLHGKSHILRGYADYVLRLERALEQVEDATQTSGPSKRPKKQDNDEWIKVCSFIQRLEADASEKGETGLAISLSKPFQRLLKYPLLFQNLLFHTDPSTYEYESTLQMVAEVENIVRSIEDEKIQKKETRPEMFSLGLRDWTRSDSLLLLNPLVSSLKNVSTFQMITSFPNHRRH